VPTWKEDPLTPHQRAAIDREKHDLFLGLVARDTVVVMIDPRLPSVQGVPDDLRRGPTLRLNFSMAFQGADLSIDDLAVRQTITLATGQKSRVTVPWSAIYAMSPMRDIQSTMWEVDAPSEVRCIPILPKDEGSVN